MADEGGALLLQQLDEPHLLGDEGVDLRRLPFQEGNDCRLCTSLTEIF